MCLARTAAKLSVSIVTQACIPAIFAVPPVFSTPLATTVIVKMENMASILQDTLHRMENIFTSAIYHNAHGGAPAAYALPP
jgi:hypothetical protein